MHKNLGPILKFYFVFMHNNISFSPSRLHWSKSVLVTLKMLNLSGSLGPFVIDIKLVCGHKMSRNSPISTFKTYPSSLTKLKQQNKVFEDVILEFLHGFPILLRLRKTAVERNSRKNATKGNKLFSSKLKKKQKIKIWLNYS